MFRIKTTMSSDVWVLFGADTSSLEAAVATAKATVNKFTRELADLSRQFVKTGADAESELGQQLLASAGRLDIAKKSLYDLKSELQGLSAGTGAEQAAHSLKGISEAAAHGGQASASTSENSMPWETSFHQADTEMPSRPSSISRRRSCRRIRT
jgi:hypothetical protein